MARIGFSTSRHLPTVRVQPRSEFLHAVGPGAAVATLREVLEPELGQLRLWVNRVDLFADWQGWTLTLDDAHRFVCRADARRTYEVGGTLTGFEFGSRKTKTLLARLYDKTAEMEVKGTDWWEAVWAERHLVGQRVWRIEFEIGRSALSDLELSRPDDVLTAVPSLWRYCASEWLTLRRPTVDSNRSRWPLDERWRAVQSASLVHGATELRFIRGHKRAQTLRRLIPALVGYLVGFAVVSGTSRIDDTLRRPGNPAAQRRGHPADPLLPTSREAPSRRGIPMSATWSVVDVIHKQWREA